MIKLIPISTIERLPETQPRAEMDTPLIDEYAIAKQAGGKFPPADVFDIDGKYVLTDGFHRIKAAEQIGLSEYPCNVHPGTMRDALLHAIGANATHGKRRTNEDKRRAVLILLQDPEWREWSNVQIAKAANVSDEFVRKIKAEIHEKEVRDLEVSSNTGMIPSKNVKVRRSGKSYRMNTEKIGKKAANKKITDDPPCLPTPSASRVSDEETTTDSTPTTQEQPSIPTPQPQSSAPPDSLAVTPNGEFASHLHIEFSTNLCKSGKCPDGGKHYVKNTQRNRMECDLVGVEITQLLHDICPLLDPQKKTGVAKALPAPSTGDVPEVQHEESKQILPESTRSQLIIPCNYKEKLTGQFIMECLSPEEIQIIENTAETENCKTQLAAIRHIMGIYSTKSIGNFADQNEKESNSWVIPSRPLSPEEQRDFIADFTKVAFTVKQQRFIRSIIEDNLFSNEMEVLNYALSLVSHLKYYENLFRSQCLHSGKFHTYPLDIQMFYPIFFSPTLGNKMRLLKKNGLCVVCSIAAKVYYFPESRGGAMS